MSNSNFVRYSRDGDQFHYLWAARRCLRLLSGKSQLVAISIEGVSSSENANGALDNSGEELIDISEYYGDENFEKADSVRYVQLKHSTQHPTDPWTASGLKTTLMGFADRYRALCNLYGAELCGEKLGFYFVSNRPIHTSVLTTVADAVSGSDPRHPNELVKLIRNTNLKGDELSGFCKLLHLEGNHEGYLIQRTMLSQDVAKYLVGDDIYAPVQLKELVTRKALSENSDNPTITKVDVLLALNSDESRLFPAPCRIQEVVNVIPRQQEAEIVEDIISDRSVPNIVHAEGGIGKSVFSTRIKSHLPTGSVCVLYDCYGNGEYRRVSAYRHRHKDALVQIANELASQELCGLLIPTSFADATDYMKSFISIVNQSISSIRDVHPNALLCIVVDAADNAQIATDEYTQSNSFIRDLLREELPEGVRLVVTCRTHRLELLDPPSTAIQHRLNPFNRSETAELLRQKFSSATEQDINEFHQLSSQNPRVQSFAIMNKTDLQEILRSLGPNPTSVEDTISDLLDDAIASLKDNVGNVEREQIDLICSGIATLRPLIPIEILALISGVQESAVRSFANDIGPPFMLTDSSVQFRDETAETWFREKFKPAKTKFGEFIEKLIPLAVNSAYVAAVLPQLMLEAGKYRDLINLALSSDGLPDGNALEMRDVELQRLQFALKASLREKCYVDTAKLAIKAGGATAGSSRRDSLIRDNTDLVAKLMDENFVQDLVSRRAFRSDSLGSNYAYEAGLLSGRNELPGEARSRLRMAHEWLNSRTKLHDLNQTNNPSCSEIAELAMAHLNIHGVESAANFLSHCTTCDFSFRTGTILARRLVDHQRYTELESLAIAAENNLGLVLAITQELRGINMNPPRKAVRHALRFLYKSKMEDSETGIFDSQHILGCAVTSLVQAGCKLCFSDRKKLASLLKNCLPDIPPHGLSSSVRGPRFSLLRAYSLESALTDKDLVINDLAYPELRAELQNKASIHKSQDASSFSSIIGALLPWHKLWVQVFLNEVSEDQLSEEIRKARKAHNRAEATNHRKKQSIYNEIAQLWFDILVMAGEEQKAGMRELEDWIDSLRLLPVFTPTLIHLIRIAARHNHTKQIALRFAQKLFHQIQNFKGDASSKVSSYVELARAVLAISDIEALGYFNCAVEVSTKIGDENIYRWDATLSLAERAADPNKPEPEYAYKLSRIAELTHEYAYSEDYLDWDKTVKVIAALCPSSCITILSRWRDRKFGCTERLLPIACEFLIEKNKLDPILQAALIGFRAYWDEVQILDSALSACGSKPQKTLVASYLCRYINLNATSAPKWQELACVLTSHNINLAEIPDFTTYIERKDHPARLINNGANTCSETGHETNGNAEQNLNEVFIDIDLSCPNGIFTAYNRWLAIEVTYRRKSQFFREACERVKAGQEDKFIRGVSEIPEFKRFDFPIFLDQIPTDWKQRPAINSAIYDAVKLYCRTNCMNITNFSEYQEFPIDTACELSGCSKSDLSGFILDAIGESSDELDMVRLFTLTSILVPTLSQNKALEALEFVLDLFEKDFLDENVGDGTWSSNITPPTDINGAIAGYIWGGLASPSSSIRWQAAHAVRGLCNLNLTEVMKKLIKIAETREGGPFVDRNLHFYKFHALQWLTIALSRAAQEQPKSVELFTKLLQDLIFDFSPHLIVRHFASEALLSLDSNGVILPEGCSVNTLKSISKSKFPKITSSNYERMNENIDDNQSETDEEILYLGWDMESYWYSNLGELFSLSPSATMRLASDIIVNDWGISKKFGWHDDERARREVFKDGETYHSHGEYPETDSLDFYLSYHAMMVVASNLLSNEQLHQDPDDPEDEFLSWFKTHNLTRQDGKWLFDRRDPCPIDKQNWMDNCELEFWPWSVTLQDFERVSGIRGKHVIISGEWTTQSGKKKETVEVYSALVSTENSHALMRALQTTPQSQYYRLPDAGDDLEINESGYLLKGWVVDGVRSYGIDKFDPWAANLHHPQIEPSDLVREEIPMYPDDMGRIWKRQDNGEEVFWCEIWSKGYDSNSYDNGRRLVGDISNITELLERINKDLILEVKIDRSVIKSQHERRSISETIYAPPYFKIYLLKSNGTLFTI